MSDTGQLWSGIRWRVFTERQQMFSSVLIKLSFNDTPACVQKRTTNITSHRHRKRRYSGRVRGLGQHLLHARPLRTRVLRVCHALLQFVAVQPAVPGRGRGSLQHRLLRFCQTSQVGGSAALQVPQPAVAGVRGHKGGGVVQVSGQGGAVGEVMQGPRRGGRGRLLSRPLPLHWVSTAFTSVGGRGDLSQRPQFGFRGLVWPWSDAAGVHVLLW